jgi:hypothetical protein
MGRNETPGAYVFTKWGNRPIVKRNPPNKFLICAAALTNLSVTWLTPAPPQAGAPRHRPGQPLRDAAHHAVVLAGPTTVPSFYCFFFAFFCCFFFVFIFSCFPFVFCENSKFIKSKQILNKNKFQNRNKFSIETNFKWEQISNGNKF